MLMVLSSVRIGKMCRSSIHPPPSALMSSVSIPRARSGDHQRLVVLSVTKFFLVQSSLHPGTIRDVAFKAALPAAIIPAVSKSDRRVQIQNRQPS